MVLEGLAAVAAKHVELGRVFQRLRRRMDRVDEESYCLRAHS